MSPYPRLLPPQRIDRHAGPFAELRVRRAYPVDDGRRVRARGRADGGQPRTVALLDAVAQARGPVWKSKFYGAFVLNHRVVLHAIDAPPARWRGDAGSSSLDGASTAAS